MRKATQAKERKKELDLQLRKVYNLLTYKKIEMLDFFDRTQIQLNQLQNMLNQAIDNSSFKEDEDTP